MSSLEAGFPLTIRDLSSRVQTVWQKIGCGDFRASVDELCGPDAELTALVPNNT